jgi:hypothetical protein
MIFTSMYKHSNFTFFSFLIHNFPQTYLMFFFFRSQNIQAYIIFGVFAAVAVILIPFLLLIYYKKCCCKNNGYRRGRPIRHDGFMDYVYLSMAGSRVTNPDNTDTSPPSNRPVTANPDPENAFNTPPPSNTKPDAKNESAKSSSVFIQDDGAVAGCSTSPVKKKSNRRSGKLGKSLQQKIKDIKEKHRRSKKQSTCGVDSGLTSPKVPVTEAGGSTGSCAGAAIFDSPDVCGMTYAFNTVKPASATNDLYEPATLSYSHAANPFVSTDDNLPPQVLTVSSTPKKDAHVKLQLIEDISNIVKNLQNEITVGREELKTGVVLDQAMTTNDNFEANTAFACLGHQYGANQSATGQSFSLQPMPIPCVADERPLTNQEAEVAFSQMAHSRSQSPEI